MTDVDEGKNRIEVGIDCESIRDRVCPAFQKLLTSLGVPHETIVFEVRGRAHTLAAPPAFECIPAKTIDPATGYFTPGFGGLNLESGTASVYPMEQSQQASKNSCFNSCAEGHLKAFGKCEC